MNRKVHTSRKKIAYLGVKVDNKITLLCKTQISLYIVQSSSYIWLHIPVLINLSGLFCETDCGHQHSECKQQLSLVIVLIQKRHCPDQVVPACDTE